MISKNKNTTYLLLASVLIIWGVILYKLLFKSGDDVQTKKFIPPQENQYIQKHEKYELLNNYPNPFTKRRTEHVPRKAINNKATINKMIQWPSILYNGCIQNGQNYKAHITIGGNYKIVNENEITDDELKIIRILPDSILLRFKSDLKWFYKKK